MPNLRYLIAPILNVAYHKQEEDGNVNFKLAMTSKDGMWQSEICCDAMTRDYHTEKDCTYTFISIPYQQNDNKNKVKPRETFFLFKLNEEKTIAFKILGFNMTIRISVNTF